ncbi:hypothetical protein FOMPIDRAFT_92486 [Fomitopsis schrenkii]|uniref:Uncharacterized protein n=1 Tax=Fomitopsis schrenkii TaxID=2126942 RepID=S8ECU4_FOMSC|nr:hypothetical protein FOMPIDRAFT_92486 [Fomitopsis schrenkii]
MEPPAWNPYKASELQACREWFNRPERPGTLLFTYNSARMKLPAFYLLDAIISRSPSHPKPAVHHGSTAGRRSLAMHPSGGNFRLGAVQSGRNEVLPLHSSGGAIRKER